MTLTPIIDNDNISSEFTAIVYDYVVASTLWNQNTPIMATTVGDIVDLDKINTASSPTDVPPYGSRLTDPISAANVADVFRRICQNYSHCHRITINNTGNLAPATASEVAAMTIDQGNASQEVTADFDATLLSRDIVATHLITAPNMAAFIADCKQSWINRCQNTNREIYSYYYCHSSHGSHSSHSSRGRR